MSDVQTELVEYESIKDDLSDARNPWRKVSLVDRVHVANWPAEIFQQAKRRATVKGIKFTITVEDIKQLALKCQGCCMLTGIPFRFDKLQMGRCHKRPFVPSIDRIDSKAGYSRKNIRIVCAAVNAALGEWGDSVFSIVAHAYVTNGSTARRLKQLDSFCDLSQQLTQINEENRKLKKEVLSLKFTVEKWHYDYMQRRAREALDAADCD